MLEGPFFKAVQVIFDTGLSYATAKTFEVANPKAAAINTFATHCFAKLFINFFNISEIRRRFDVAKKINLSNDAVALCALDLICRSIIVLVATVFISKKIAERSNPITYKQIAALSCIAYVQWVGFTMMSQSART